MEKPTIKEYKATMEGATDALNAVLCDPDGKCCISCSDGDRKAVDDALEKLSIAGGNIAPELIRVIELAEEALETCGVNRHGQEYHDWDKIKQALSEIRKLKGE